VDTSTLISLIGGPVLSAVIAWLLAQHYRREVGVALAFGVCVVFALAVTIINDGLVLTGAHDALGWAKLIILNGFAVLGSAYLTYEHILQPTGVAARLNASGPQVGATTPPAVPADKPGIP